MKQFINNILSLTLLLTLSMASSKSYAQDLQKQPIEAEQNLINVTITGTTLHVKNAETYTLELYSITGEKVMTVHIDSNSKNFDLGNLPRGYYIVKIGKKYTRKVYVR